MAGCARPTLRIGNSLQRARRVLEETERTHGRMFGTQRLTAGYVLPPHSRKSALIGKWNLCFLREGEMYEQASSREWVDFVVPIQDQDAEFCRKMRAAIKSGHEVCPIGVSTKPGTENPIVADGWKAPCVRVS